MFKVTNNLKVKVQGVIKVFPVGRVINLPEKSAQMFIQQGKIVSIPEEPQITRNNEPTAAETKALHERMCIMGENAELNQVAPFVTDFGVLVIPSNSDKKYHYWNGGQSACTTLKALGRCDLIVKYKSIYSN